MQYDDKGRAVIPPQTPYPYRRGPTIPAVIGALLLGLALCVGALSIFSDTTAGAAAGLTAAGTIAIIGFLFIGYNGLLSEIILLTNTLRQTNAILEHHAQLQTSALLYLRDLRDTKINQSSEPESAPAPYPFTPANFPT